ncbi:MAG: hypothetical protein LQ351_005128 [Letrouitia transgressa]|nr:MAG: hypothetical protein LQ351_005128 [Letrouitia transgressa]
MDGITKVSLDSYELRTIVGDGSLGVRLSFMACELNDKLNSSASKKELNIVNLNIDITSRRRMQEVRPIVGKDYQESIQ